MAVAETIRNHTPADLSSVCGKARCGGVRLGERGDVPAVYAGMLPIKAEGSITLALTAIPGGEADPRQAYTDAYDNPAFTLHILGEDLVKIDRTAQAIREGCDRTAHIETEHGTINTLSVGPPRRIIRSDRPRYDLQLTIEAEYIRQPSLVYPYPSRCNRARCGFTRLGKMH